VQTALSLNGLESLVIKANWQSKQTISLSFWGVNKVEIPNICWKNSMNREVTWSWIFYIFFSVITTQWQGFSKFRL
jgi:hypothetical protein